MMTLDKIGMAQKFTFLTIILCAISVFVVLFIVNFSLINLNDKYLNSELATRKIIIEKSYVGSLWNFDTQQVVELSRTFLTKNEHAYIMAIRVTDPAGKVLFNETNSTQKFATFNEYSQLPYTKSDLLKITKNNKLLATIDIVFTNAGFFEKVKNIIQTLFIVSIVILSVTSFGIFLLFNNYLSRPLNELLGHVGQLKHEDYSTKNYKKLPNELQLIADALNFTSIKIKKTNDDLKHNAENLEKIVEVRTRELEISISENVNAQRLAAVGEMAGGIAHEINNPLTVILGNISRAKRLCRGQEKEEELTESLDKALLMIDRITKIIKGLKTISRNGETDEMKEFNIRPFFDEIQILIEMKVKTLDLKLDIQIDESIDLVYGREVQIAQVIVNLINNSVDAIANLSERWIKIDVVDIGARVEFQVTDSGAGISEELQAKIMYPFFTTKEVGLGTGLGLSLSKGIIKEHGGEMIYNNKCKNTQFVFSLQKHKAISVKIAA
jgi:two-component system NtrC family sensor kinase